MKNELVIELFSDRQLTHQVARNQITTLSTFANGLFRPDRCDVYEPIREPFELTNIDRPVSWLTRPTGQFMYKKGKPAHILGWISNRVPGEVWVSEGTGKPAHRVENRQTPRFINTWTMYFDGRWAKKTGIEQIRQLALELFRISESEFGFLTTLEDLDSKNYLITQMGAGRSMRYEGKDPEFGIPGLYWMTFFGPQLARTLSLDKLNQHPVSVQKLPRNAAFLQFGDTPDTCQNETTLSEQREIIEILGVEMFFDIRTPERALVSPFQTDNRSSTN